MVYYPPRISFASPAVEHRFHNLTMFRLEPGNLNPVCNTEQSPPCHDFYYVYDTLATLLSHIYLEPEVPMYNNGPLGL